MEIPCCNSFKPIILFLIIIVGTTWSENNTNCPFHFLYLIGDGILDMGNSVEIHPLGPLLPPTRYPYGITYPGCPNGRWSDGLIDADYVAEGVDLPSIKPYLSLDYDYSRNSRRYDGVAFAVARSTVVDTSFFFSRGIYVPPYNTPLSAQINWFRNYVNSIFCKNGKDCSKRQLRNSFIVIQFSEANDIGYALEQGRSIQQVTTYVPLIVDAQVNAAREAMKLGATRIAYATFTPLGCYPYILTALYASDPTAYDEQGCLRAVNDLIESMNSALTTSFNGLQAEFRNVSILGADFYTVARTIIRQTSVPGSNVNPALTSCCGIGGKYKYDKNRFCGSLNVPVCPNPNDYVFWDGLHFTQEATRRIVNILLAGALPPLNCTST